ncbi:MAG: hypothetical protein ICV53_07950 [Flavisolibacter sp.]|nr:hypothetical protein [Flavisolibacter sp.]
MKIIRCLIPLLFLCTLQATAQLGTLRATLDKSKILIGEPIQLTLETVVPKNSPVQWPVIDTIPHFEVMRRSKLDSQVAERNMRLTQHITLTSWDSGVWMLPSFSLPQNKANRTLPLRVYVTHTPFNPEQDYNDIKEIIEVQKPAKITWYWYAIGAALLLLLFWLLFPKRKKEKADALSGVGAYKEALAQLEKLKKEGSADAKAFYTELIAIFRTYVHRRKGIQSFQKTTDDLSMQLKELKLPAEDYHQLVEVLRLSDVVKFARYIPLTAENEKSLNVIRKSIMALENLS